MIAREFALFLQAVGFLTRLPLPKMRAFSPDDFARTVRYYPWVGLLLGVDLAIFAYLLQLVWPPMIVALLTISAGILVTGALHQDGLADFADGLGARGDAQVRLRVMRESALGGYGAIALILLLLLQFAALTNLPPWQMLLALPLAHGAARLAMSVAIYWGPNARANGLADSLTSGMSRADILSLGLAFLLLCLLALLAYPPGAVLTILLVCGLAIAGMRSLYKERLGGYTGDCLGALEQLCETLCLMGLLAWA